jgi:hypothetical protein
LYKAEVIHRRAPWKTKESVELATLEEVRNLEARIAQLERELTAMVRSIPACQLLMTIPGSDC